PANQTTDTFLSGSCYWALKGNREDYWYVPVQEMAQRPWQTGGEASYFAASKETEKLSVMEFGGE
ncbi:MAG: hypothetical protein GQ541_08875, partial [Desulfovibrionaceae bacterium]|nr:hypothetical protein [Desulfovibrionaceae bacterium]